MEAGEQTLMNKLWVKLQGLPNADPIELGAFLILLAFILVIIVMMVLACCCCCNSSTKGARRLPITQSTATREAGDIF